LEHVYWSSVVFCSDMFIFVGEYFGLIGLIVSI
jgi:hypothetical protein